MSNRPETGPMKFGDDWTGIFIRGDNAFYYAMALRTVLDQSEGDFDKIALQGLLSLLASSDEREGSKEETQVLKAFHECVQSG